MKHIKIFENFADSGSKIVDIFIDGSFDKFLEFISDNYPKSGFRHMFNTRSWDSYNRDRIFVLFKSENNLGAMTVSYDGKIFASSWDNGRRLDDQEVIQVEQLYKDYLEDIRIKDTLKFSNVINKLDSIERFKELVDYFKNKYPDDFKTGNILSRYSF